MLSGPRAAGDDGRRIADANAESIGQPERVESSNPATGDYILPRKLNEFDEVDRETIETSI
jgi:hypothetical protein